MDVSRSLRDVGMKNTWYGVHRHIQKEGTRKVPLKINEADTIYDARWNASKSYDGLC